VEILEK